MPAIIEFVPSLKPTGMVTVALDLAQMLRQRGCKVVFWYLDDLPGAVQEDAIKVSLKGPLPSTEGFDVIHSHGLRPDLACYLHRKKLGIPTFSTIHSYYTEDTARNYSRIVSTAVKPIWRRLLKNHRTNVVLQSHMAKYYRKTWGLTNIEIIQNTRLITPIEPDQALLDQLLELKKTHALVVTAGGAIPLKGLNAMAPALKLLPDFTWVHFGTGPLLHELQNQAEAAGVRAFFPGFVAEAANYFQLADVFAMPSLVEGMPLALLEAVQQNVPSVVNDIPVFRAVFNDAEVMHVDVTKPGLFAEAIQMAVKNKDKLVANASKRYMLEYTEEVVATKYLALINALTNQTTNS